MATPTTNSVAVTNVSTAAMPELIDGEKWGGGLGVGATLGYSFINSNSHYLDDYGFVGPNGSQEPDAVYYLNNTEKAAIRAALAVLSSVINVTFTEVTDTTTQNGDIRFGGTSNTGAYAHAYFPYPGPESGDVWFSPDWNTDASGGASPGEYEFMTILHEMGHALGLKHSFEGGAVLPVGTDNYFYTIMSYRASPWSPDNSADYSNYASFYPTTPMYYDLVALQALYGRNGSHNAGNTTYSFSEGSTYFQTIDDVSGVDTIKFSGSGSCVISLVVGTFSDVGASIEFYNGSSFVYSGQTVCIGPNTIIENAIGGSGGDTLTGNDAGNSLAGNGGGDALFGGRGNDVLVGAAGGDTMNAGAGNDTIEGDNGHDSMTGGAGADTFIFKTAPSAANSDTITDFAHASDKIQIEDLVFVGIGATTGTLAPGKFWTGADAHDPDDRIIYDANTGKLFFDDDGNGAHAKVLIATLTAHLALANTDFQVI